MAAITHSLVIVAVILLLTPVVARIPLAVLGGVLVVTAVKMVDHIRVLTVIRAHLAEAVVFTLTAVVTILVNLVTAVEVGLVVAGVLALRAVASGSGATQEDLADHHDGPVDDVALLSEHIAVYRMDGALFFGAVPRFLERFRQVEGVQVVIVRMRGLTFIDVSGADALARIIEELEGRGITVLVKGHGPSTGPCWPPPGSWPTSTGGATSSTTSTRRSPTPAATSTAPTSTEPAPPDASVATGRRCTPSARCGPSRAPRCGS